MRSLFLVRHLPVLLWTAALLAGLPILAQPSLTGPEFFIDPTSEVTAQSWNQMDRVTAAADGDGRLMVVWHEALPGLPLRGRAFDAAGRPMGPAFPLDTGVQAVVSATLAPAAPEGFLLTWQTSEPLGSNQTRYRLLARRLSPSGRPSGDVIPIRGPVASQISSMQTASASDGSFVAVWSEAEKRVFLRRFDAAGRPLAPAAPLPGRTPTEERSAPSLVVLDDGEIRIAWRSRHAGDSSSTLWVRRFDRNGVPLAAPVRPLPKNVEVRSSSIAFGPDGGYLAAWTTWKDDVLHLRASAPDGTAFNEHQAALFSWGQITAERGGTFLMSGTDPYRFPHCAVTGLQVEADGTPRGPAGCLTNPSVVRSYVSSLSITETAGGGFALFWSESGRTGVQDDVPRLFGQRLATALPGTLQIERARSAVLESAPAPMELRILRRDGTAGTVSVDYRLTGAASGSGTVTFTDGDSTPRIISIPVSGDDVPGNDRIVRVALSQPTGGAVLGAPRQAVVEVRDDDEPSPLLARAEPFISLASAGGGESSLEDPDLAASPDGGFEAVWGHSEEYGRFIYDFALQGVRFDAAAFPTDAFEIPCDQQPLRVRLALHPAGDFMVFWQSWAAGSGSAQRFDARGTAIGPVVSLGFEADDAAALPQGRFVAVGRGRDRAGDGLFAHWLSTRGLDRRSPVPVTRAALQPGSPAVVATDGMGRSVVVWSVAPTGAGPAGLFARRFNALGVPLGPAVRVSQWEGHDVAPSVAMDVHGNFAVAWQRSWDGDGTGVYARIFDAAGAPLSDEIPVNSAVVENQEAPSVALTGDGRFAVFWQSTSDAFFGVAGQLFARDGTRLGSEAQIAPDRERPTAVWSDRGYFVTLFCYDRDSYYYGDLCVEIAARRLPL